MKYIRQILIIMTVTLLGELLHFYFPLPVPASVYGLVLMLLALSLKWVRLPQVQETADFLISLMPLMFVPPGVALLVLWSDLKPALLAFATITLVSTVLVMGVTGKTVQWVDRLQKRIKK